MVHSVMERAERWSGARVSPSFTLAATSLGFVVVQLDVTIVNVALPRIGASFGDGVAALQWVVNAYTVVFASLILTAGALADRIGAKRIFMAGFGVFTLASFGCGAAPSLPILIGCRALQGVGAASLVPCSLALLNHAFPHEGARARAVGIWAGGAGVAVAAGPVVGGLLVGSIGWRSIFYLNLPIGLIGIWLTLRYVAETSRRRPRGLDLAGQVLAIVALADLAASTIEGGARGWGDPLILAGFGLFVLAAAAFIAIEARRRDPMLPLAFFRRSDFSAATFVGLMINIGFYGLIFVLSLFFQQQQHLGPLATGLAFLPMTAIVTIANVLGGRAAARWGPRWPIVAGMALSAASAFLLLGIATATPYRAIWPQMLGLGAGVGFAVPPITSALLAAVQKEQSGIASGVLNTTRQAGSVIGVALFGSLIARPEQFIPGLQIGLMICAGLAALGCAVALFGIGYRPR
jgi:DHA2 family methylenomycin A resistance protein-like MFS transporter